MCKIKKLIAQGAEAKLYRDSDTIVKHRFQKKYRVPELDKKLRSFRTRREAKVLQKLAVIGFPAPRLLKNDGKETIEIKHIKGTLLRNVLEKSNYRKISREIGEKIAMLHNNHIIHHDLTTSNMVLDDGIYFIDFGLSFFSHKIEDKAVDLHLLKEALESKHHSIWEACFKAVVDSYAKKADRAKDILKRLRQVEQRGRYKRKK